MYCLGVFPGRDEGRNVDGCVMYCFGVFPGWVESSCVDRCVPGLCDDRRDACRYSHGKFVFVISV